MKTKGFLKRAMMAAVLATGIALPAASIDSTAMAMGHHNSMLPGVDVVDQKQFRHSRLASDSDAAVGTQLVLAMDTSGSMSNEEFEIELQATANAINSELFRSAIKYKSGEQSVAIVVVDFDSTAMLRVPWVDIRGSEINDKPYDPENPSQSSAAPDKLDQLAQEIISLPRRGNGGTTISSAMRLSKNLFLGAPWRLAEGGKRVLDVFGDGSGNGYAMSNVRNELSALGVTINGFAIVNDEPNLEEHFKQYLVTQNFVTSPDGALSEPGRVWAVARNLRSENNASTTLKSFFGEVATAMKQKITVEVAGLDDYHRVLVLLERKPAIPVPEPN